MAKSFRQALAELIEAVENDWVWSEYDYSEGLSIKMSEAKDLLGNVKGIKYSDCGQYSFCIAQTELLDLVVNIFVDDNLVVSKFFDCSEIEEAEAYGEAFIKSGFCETMGRPKSLCGCQTCCFIV